jgi:DNA-binding CsgD family transcriptional regulator
MRKASLEERLAKELEKLHSIAENIPGAVIVMDIKSTHVVYLSPTGCRLLGVSLEQIKALGAQYHSRFFNDEESNEYVPKIIGLLERNNPEETISFFQQVRTGPGGSWQWYCSSIKIFMWDDEGTPRYTITVAQPVHFTENISIKAERLLEENNFLRHNYQKFELLTRREREILALLSLGKSAPEIAAETHLSILTVNTHRRNIKEKLGVSSIVDMLHFARAFDLV